MKDKVVSLVQANSKGLAGGVASAIVAYTTTRGVAVPKDVNDALVVLVTFIIGFAVTWIAPKNQ